MPKYFFKQNVKNYLRLEINLAFFEKKTKSKNLANNTLCDEEMLKSQQLLSSE